MMTLDEARARLADPATPAATLAQIAADHPELRRRVLAHPACYPALREWILTQPQQDPTTAATPERPVTPVSRPAVGPGRPSRRSAGPRSRFLGVVLRSIAAVAAIAVLGAGAYLIALGEPADTRIVLATIPDAGVSPWRADLPGDANCDYEFEHRDASADSALILAVPGEDAPAACHVFLELRGVAGATSPEPAWTRDLTVDLDLDSDVEVTFDAIPEGVNSTLRLWVDGQVYPVSRGNGVIVSRTGIGAGPGFLNPGTTDEVLWTVDESTSAVLGDPFVAPDVVLVEPREGATLEVRRFSGSQESVLLDSAKIAVVSSLEDVHRVRVLRVGEQALVVSDEDAESAEEGPWCGESVAIAAWDVAGEGLASDGRRVLAEDECVEWAGLSGSDAPGTADVAVVAVVATRDDGTEVAAVDPRRPIDELWIARVDEPDLSLESLASEDVAFLRSPGSTPTLVAVSRSDGVELWRAELDAPGRVASASAAEFVVALPRSADDDDPRVCLRILDPADGSATGQVSCATEEEPRLVAGRWMAFDAGDGELVRLYREAVPDE